MTIAMSVWLPGWARILVLVVSLAVLPPTVPLVRVAGAARFGMRVSWGTWLTVLLWYPYSAGLALAWHSVVGRFDVTFHWNAWSVFAACFVTAGIYFPFGVRLRGVNPYNGSVVWVRYHSFSLPLFFLLYVFLWSGNTLTDLDGWLQGAAVLCGVGVIAALSRIPALGLRLRYPKDLERTHDWRSQRARSIKEGVAHDRPVEPFVLYLRSFTVTDHLPARPAYRFELDPNPDDMLLPWDDPVPKTSHWNPHLDFETVLYAALGDELPTVALGPSISGPGVARIEEQPDDKWRVLFAQLAAAARYVVMIPGATQWVQWEMAWLCDHDCLGRTVFVMPEHLEIPEVLPGRSGKVRGSRTQRPRTTDSRSEWERARALSRKNGLILPEYEPRGMLFMLNDAGRPVARSQPLGLVGAFDPIGALKSRLRELVGQPAHRTSTGPHRRR
ncbi:hypothetical protein [Streptomyces kanamyceticus]|uniref:hypothetical protein n=1 Tax=Streptomyces kanamyceticus TaxID=1967 RepID=UPI00123D1DB6|nr:hypothetical protein [Streptomyces kanamyceticus]